MRCSSKELRRRLRPAPRRSIHALSFADLMINLLTFFVLLFAWSEPGDGARFSAGLGGFLHHLDSWGLPPDEAGARERDERIRELEGRYRAFAPRALHRPARTAAPLPAVVPFSEAGFVPGVARFAPGSAEILEAEMLDDAARALRGERGCRARLELAADGLKGGAISELASRRLEAARARVLAAGIEPARVVVSLRDAASDPAPGRLDLRLLRENPAR